MTELLPNCWEITGCGLEKDGINVAETGECIASKTEMGHSCWAVAGTANGGEVQCPYVAELGFCSVCKVHRQYNRSTGDMGKAVRQHHPGEHLRYNRLLIDRSHLKKKE